MSVVEAACAHEAAKQLGVCWQLMKWKPTFWLHCMVVHNAWFVREFGSVHMFSSVPMERRNSPFKRHPQNSFRGWPVRNPPITKRAMAHILDICALDEGLKGTQKVGGVQHQSHKRQRDE